MTTLVLSVGNDSTLLAIRELMLAGAGYSVVSALGPQQFVHKLFESDFDVVVLCTSLSPTERQRMAALVRQHRPSARLLALTEKPGHLCDGADSTICGDTRDLVRALASSGSSTTGSAGGTAA